MASLLFKGIATLEAVSKNRRFGYRSLSRNGLRLTLFTQSHIWHLHDNNADLMRPGGWGRGSCWESATWPAAPRRWTLSSILAETRGVWIKGPFNLRFMTPGPLFHHCLKVRDKGQKLEVAPQDSNEQKNKLMFRNLRPAVFCFV